MRDEGWVERERVVEHLVSLHDDMAGEEWGEARAANESSSNAFEKYAGQGERQVVRHTVMGLVLAGAEHHRERRRRPPSPRTTARWRSCRSNCRRDQTPTRQGRPLPPSWSRAPRGPLLVRR